MKHPFSSSLVFLFLICSICLGYPEARTWYVKADGSGDAASIREAIYQATNGDTILVSAGRYTGENNRNIDYLERTLVIRSESGPYQTIIDCQGQGRGFLFINGEGPAAKLEGLTIVNSYLSDGDGGGICCIGSSPTISNCIFRGNHIGGNGGGIYCSNNSNPAITGCVCVKNSAQYGGGICCVTNSAASIIECVMAQNSAHAGGGVHLSGSPAYLSQCIIVDNQASLAGGVGITNASPTILRSTIVGNRSNLFGGGLDCINSMPVLGGSHIDRNSIYHNTAEQGGSNLRTNYPIDEAQYIFWGRMSDSAQDSLVVAEQMLLTPGASINWWPMSVQPRTVIQKIGSTSDTLYYPELRIELEVISMSAFGDSTISVTAWPDSMPPAVYGGKPLGKWFDITPGSALGTFSANLLLGYVQLELDSSEITDESSLYCARYAEGRWTSLPGQTDPDDNWVRCSTDQFSIWGIGGSGGPLTPVTEGEPFGATPMQCALSQNFPNPFNAFSQISFQLSRECVVSLEIFNIIGGRVRILTQGRFAQGHHQVIWDGSDENGQPVGSGLYFCRLQAEDIRRTVKMILLR